MGSMEGMKVEAACDGSFVRIGETSAAAGAACVLQPTASGEVKRKIVVARVPGRNSGEAEAYAARLALNAVAPGTNVRIITDSWYVVAAMRDGRRRRRDHALWSELDAAAAMRCVEWVWNARRHGTPEQKICDAAARRLARRTARAQSGLRKVAHANEQ